MVLSRKDSTKMTHVEAKDYSWEIDQDELLYILNLCIQAYNTKHESNGRVLQMKSQEQDATS